MNAHLREQLWSELQARGFDANGNAPNVSIWLTAEYLADCTISELFDMMVTRREKVWNSVPVMGQKIARENYDDVVLVIDALKQVIERSLER